MKVMAWRATLTRDGRAHGAYAYALLCQEHIGTPIHIKISSSISPLARLAAERKSFPATPRRLAFAHVPTIAIAESVRDSLLEDLAGWQVYGRWLSLPESAKATFNRALHRALLTHQSKDWPLRWDQMPVARLIRSWSTGARENRDTLRRLGVNYGGFLGPALDDFMKSA